MSKYDQFLKNNKKKCWRHKKSRKFASTKWNSIFYANEEDLLCNDVIHERYAIYLKAKSFIWLIFK